jgi:hypothetical protein
MLAGRGLARLWRRCAQGYPQNLWVIRHASRIAGRPGDSDSGDEVTRGASWNEGECSRKGTRQRLHPKKVKGGAMKTVHVTSAQHKVLQILSRKDISAIQRNPRLVPGAKHLLLACKKIVKKVEEMPQYASRKKRENAYRHIVALCRKAIDGVERQ